MEGEELDAWFVDQVLPLEPVLERFLRRNWRDLNDIADLRQEVYARVYDKAQPNRLESVQAFVLTTARNLLIDLARREKVVSIDAYADIETIDAIADEIGLERIVMARSELRALQAALTLLPPRCREVVELRKIEGLSQREVAARMGITEDTVERQVSKGIRALANALSNTGSAPAKAFTAPSLQGRKPVL